MKAKEPYLSATVPGVLEGRQQSKSKQPSDNQEDLCWVRSLASIQHLRSSIIHIQHPSNNIWR